MNLEGRKSNLYFDQLGKQILPGDLLKVFHFRSRNRNYYMYKVIVMEGTEGDELNFPVMSIQSYYGIKPHCRLYVLCDNEQRVFYDGKIISMQDSQTKRQRIKVTPKTAINY